MSVSGEAADALVRGGMGAAMGEAHVGKAVVGVVQCQERALRVGTTATPAPSMPSSFSSTAPAIVLMISIRASISPIWFSISCRAPAAAGATWVRAARALLRWDQKTLAEAAAVSVPTIKRMEGVDGRVSGQIGTLTAVKEALEKGGVSFIEAGAYQGDGEPCVRLRLEGGT